MVIEQNKHPELQEDGMLIEQNNSAVLQHTGMLIEPKQNGRITTSSYGSQMTKKIWSCDVILHYKIAGYDDKTFLKTKFENVMGSNPNECYGKAVEMLKEQFKEEEGLEILGGSASFNFEE